MDDIVHVLDKILNSPAVQQDSVEINNDKSYSGYEIQMKLSVNKKEMGVQIRHSCSLSVGHTPSSRLTINTKLSGAKSWEVYYMNSSLKENELKAIAKIVEKFNKEIEGPLHQKRQEAIKNLGNILDMASIEKKLTG